ncbi:metacaspase-9 [Andrographis paniculata]|uniref:metacaspase-9 n=1 Tax=Andrographis paniculata TaxID=175694 RepID=UPI0021E794C7|nr:metacaspase-9 [Andrographis paniculata]XP_051149098.1 metacaspase-9 [Andrographis paniculata]
MDRGGKKMALLVGCNYPGTPHELRGCHNDVLAMRDVLIGRFGFDHSCVELLVDKPGSPIMPTGTNIKKALDKMVNRAEHGDVLFFHYSGHGTLINSRHNLFGKEEAIVPCDLNLITSVDFRELVNRVPKGATFTILSDSCHSGGLIDKETEQIGPSNPLDNGAKTVDSPAPKPKHIPSESILEQLTSITSKRSCTDIGAHLLELFGSDASLAFHEPTGRRLGPDEGILLSGCQTDETSADVEEAGENGIMKACGAFSNAVLTVLKARLPEAAGRMSNREVVVMAREVLAQRHFVKQHPCLYCSDQNANAPFLGTFEKL